MSRLDVVDRSIAFHGGPRYENSSLALDLCSKSGCARLEVDRRGGLFDYRVEAETGTGAIRRARVTNDRVEEFLDGQRRPVDADRAARLTDWVMQRVYFTFLPYKLNDPGVWKEDLGIEDWDGQRLHRVKVTFTPGSSTDADDEFTFWFDPQTARLELFAYSYLRSGGGLRFRRLTNFRRAAGILVFDQENFGIDGPNQSVDSITPDFVRSRMRHVSTVTLNNLRSLDP